jgi:PAS domain-containing protein
MFDGFNILELSSDGNIVDINANIMKLFGAEDRSIFVGKHASEFVGKKAYDAAWKNLLKGKPYENTLTVEADGKSLPIKQRYVPILSKQGELLRAYILVFTK